MNKSDAINELAAALSKAQGQLKGASENAVNPFFKNSYADIGAYIAVAAPVLSANGLAVTQLVGGDGTTVTVETLLMHSSGQYVGSAMSLPVGDEKGKSLAQAAGGLVTYLRRYSYAAILGMYAEDNDGTEAPKPAKPIPATKPAAAAPPENGNATKDTTIDRADKMLSAVTTRVGVYYKDVAELRTAVSLALGNVDYQWPEPHDDRGWRDAYAAAIKYAEANPRLAAKQTAL